jgi:hypothetical protein
VDSGKAVTKRFATRQGLSLFASPMKPEFQPGGIGANTEATEAWFICRGLCRAAKRYDLGSCHIYVGHPKEHKKTG